MPIRLALRSISAGKSPITSPPAVVASSGATGVSAPAPAGRAAEALADAKRKLEAGDGDGCVASANRALGLDPRYNDDAEFKKTRAICVMRTGKCDDGTRDYKAALAAEDFKREKTDGELDHETRETANENCSSATAHTDFDFIERAWIELKAASKVDDGKTCKELSLKVYERIKKIRAAPRAPDARWTDQTASNVLLRAPACIARSTHRCSDGLAAYRLQSTVIPTPMSGWEKISQASWEDTVKRENIPCK